MLARMKLENEEFNRHGRNTQLNQNRVRENKKQTYDGEIKKKTLERPQLQHCYDIVQW